jgi:hypothetical protein
MSDMNMVPQEKECHPSMRSIRSYYSRPRIGAPWSVFLDPGAEFFRLVAMIARSLDSRADWKATTAASKVDILQKRMTGENLFCSEKDEQDEENSATNLKMKYNFKVYFENVNKAHR